MIAVKLVAMYCVWYTAIAFFIHFDSISKPTHSICGLIKGIRIVHTLFSLELGMNAVSSRKKRRNNFWRDFVLIQSLFIKDNRIQIIHFSQLLKYNNDLSLHLRFSMQFYTKLNFLHETKF